MENYDRYIDFSIKGASKFKTYLVHNIAWITNKIHVHPSESHCYPVSQNHNLHDESLPILHYLVKLNILKFYTLGSQPFQKQAPCRQVQWVSGIVEDSTLEQLKKITANKYPNICFSWDEICKHDPKEPWVTYLHEDEFKKQNPVFFEYEVKRLGINKKRGGIPFTAGCQWDRISHNVHRLNPKSELYPVISIHSICWDSEDTQFWSKLIQIFEQLSE